MTSLEEYNVEKSLIGLGPDVLMDLLNEIEYIEDAHQFVWVNKNTFALQNHNRFNKSMENKKYPVDSTAILPTGGDLNQQGLTFALTKGNNNASTVVFDPIISEGIAYFEGVFHNHLWFYFDIGITEPSVQYRQNEGPQRYGNQLIRYCSGKGQIGHIYGYEISGNEVFKDEQHIGVEVNMTTTPRTVHFFVNDVEQPVFVSGIPDKIRFFAHIWYDYSSFELLKFEKYHTRPKSKGLPNSLALEWGKIWIDQDEIVDPDDGQQQFRQFRGHRSFRAYGLPQQIITRKQNA
ncbi:MAG: hypothetical protein EZS28_026729 [Streblomastix strix]|uniref:Concanavalin A-like lectin/glucanase domain-containing protein n=1 Tax=Streblomastix strix TaxID=222440 RepID=A0A5J4V5U4_9EUKA|nr:MAG: hypothetical protein EZS28_026729 [Streblomastix strix]